MMEVRQQEESRNTADVHTDTFDLKDFAWFDKEKGIKIPLRPFAGEMGVAPGAPGPHSTIPPYRTGGNIDTKHMVKGTVLYLPIECKGALFSMRVELYTRTRRIRA